MAHHQNNPERKGIAKQLTLDHEAIELLYALAVGSGAQGRLVSELLRAEVTRRVERQKFCETMRHALEAKAAGRV